MRSLRVWRALPLTLALCAAPAALFAIEPARVGAPFEAKVGPAKGGPEVEMTFTLALSDVSTYPVTITAVAGSVEEQLWQGTLPEGVYRFRGQLQRIRSGPVRLVLRVRLTNLEAGKNKSYHVFRRWDGALP